MKRALVVIALGLLGCGESELHYHTVEFPGFSLEVPRSVKYTGAHTAVGYVIGMSDEGPNTRYHTVKITWWPGSADEEELSRYADDIVENQRLKSRRLGPPRAITVGTHEAFRIDTRSEDGETITLVDIQCGKRAIQLTMGSAKHIQGMQQRVLDSFHCHPIADQEMLLGKEIPIGADNPALFDGWSRVASRSFVLHHGDQFLVAIEAPGADGDESDMISKLPQMLGDGTSWEPGPKEPRGARTVHRGTLVAGDVRTSGAIATWQCPDRNTTVMALLAGVLGEPTPDTAFLQELRCPKAGDPPLDLPMLTVDE